MIRALVVDDDADLLDMMTFMLQANEIEVMPLLDGNLFFDTIRSTLPNIILLDICLGNCDGRILCKELKGNPLFSNIPVILYSAADISKESLDEQCAGNFMRKPFDMDILVNRIHTLAA